jgi:hypothetical protein
MLIPPVSELVEKWVEEVDGGVFEDSEGLPEIDEVVVGAVEEDRLNCVFEETSEDSVDKMGIDPNDTMVVVMNSDSICLVVVIVGVSAICSAVAPEVGWIIVSVDVVEA